MEEKALTIAPASLPAVNKPDDEAMWNLIAAGDLKGLTPKQRTDYYLHLCTSLGMNPATQPFQYMTLNGKMILYALKGATDQLRGIRGVSIEGLPRITDAEDYITAEVMVRDREGRTDFDLGCVYAGGLKGEARANAKMKALTKAKRRATLSICGLGMLDELEVEDIPGARPSTWVAAPRQFQPEEDESQEPLNSAADMEEAMPSDPPVVAAFAAIGVSRAQLESFIQRDLLPDVKIPTDERAMLERAYKDIRAKRTTWEQVVAGQTIKESATAGA